MASYVEQFAHQLRNFYRALAECDELTRELVSFNVATWSAIAEIDCRLFEGWARDSQLMRIAYHEIERAKPQIAQLQVSIETVMGESNHETRNYIDATIGKSVFECDFDEEPMNTCWRCIERRVNQILNGLSEWDSCNLAAFDSCSSEEDSGSSDEFEALYQIGFQELQAVSVPDMESQIRTEFQIVRDRHVSQWKQFPDSDSAGLAMDPQISGSAVRSKQHAKGQRLVTRDDEGTWWVHEELLRSSDAD